MNIHLQKQPLKGVLEKRCSENMQQIYRRTPMLKCDFNKVAKVLNTPTNPIYLYIKNLYVGRGID